MLRADRYSLILITEVGRLVDRVDTGFTECRDIQQREDP